MASSAPKTPQTSKLLLHEEPLQVLPGLAIALGLNEAIILQQLHYWLRKKAHTRDGQDWFYNTYADWQKQFPFWSISTIKRSIYALEKIGVVFSARYNNNPIDKTKWYAINYQKLNELCDNTTAHFDTSTCQIDTSRGQDDTSTDHIEPSTCQIEPSTAQIDTSIVSDCTDQYPETNTESKKENPPPIVPPSAKRGKARPQPQDMPEEIEAQEAIRFRVMDTNFEAWLQRRYPQVDALAQWEYFVNYCISHGKGYVEFRAAFMNSFGWENSPAQKRQARSNSNTKTTHDPNNPYAFKVQL